MCITASSGGCIPLRYLLHLRKVLNVADYNPLCVLPLAVLTQGIAYSGAAIYSRARSSACGPPHGSTNNKSACSTTMVHGSMPSWVALDTAFVLLAAPHNITVLFLSTDNDTLMLAHNLSHPFVYGGLLPHLGDKNGTSVAAPKWCAHLLLLAMQRRIGC